MSQNCIKVVIVNRGILVKNEMYLLSYYSKNSLNLPICFEKFKPSNNSFASRPSAFGICIVLKRLSKDMTKNIVLASIYRLTAVNFWESAKIIEKNLEKRIDGSPSKITAIPFYFLVSHAVELFLKSTLLKRGFTANNLKKYDYRHNLKMLLEALQKKGVDITPATVDVINGLHLQHKNHALRYDAFLGSRKLYWPPTDLINKALDELLLLTRLSTQGK